MEASTEKDISTALRLFGSIFQREIDQELLNEIQSRRNDLNPVLGSDPLADLNLKQPRKAIEILAVEYCRLFIGPHGHMPPVESIVRGEQRFWGKSTEAVMDCYKSWGFEPKKEAHSFPDHISMELDCLALLEEKNRHREASDFAHKHLLQWLHALIAHIENNAELTFYQAWAGGLLTLLVELYQIDAECGNLGGRRG